MSDSLRDRLLARTAAVTTGGVRRLLRTGRTSASLARAITRAARDGTFDAEAIERAVGALGELKGVAMKAGQMLGYLDPSMPEEMRRAFSALQTAAPATPTSEVHRAIEAALGDRAATLLTAMEAAPIAVASIGQVHRAELPGVGNVAVKVRHPGIVDALGNEFKVAGAGAAVADAMLGNVRGFVEEARATLLGECDYALEAERQRALGALFADDPVIVIPAVIDGWCAPGVLVTRWRPGRSLDALAGEIDAAELRDRIGAALFRFHLGALYRAGLFHADPHPGNYAVDDDGHLVVYDFGCVRTFSRELVAALARLATATRADDLPAMRSALVACGGAPPARADVDRDLRRFLRGFYAAILEDGARAIAPDAGFDAREIIRDKLAMHRLALPPQILFLLRLRFGLYAVLARLGAVVDWSALEASLAREAGLRQ